MSQKSISDIDTNLKVETSIAENDIAFYDIKQQPFQVYGLYNYQNEPVFKRLPDDVAAATSKEVSLLYTNTSGGRVRFATNSNYVAIKSIMPDVMAFPHMTLAGTSGFDMYIDYANDSIYFGTFMPSIGMKNGYESILYFPDNKQRNITINFPLYNNVDNLYIGLQKTASVSSGAQYRSEKPLLYYGSSITQGGCASRPGNSYQAIISRQLNLDYINLGFSGSAKGEDTLVEYMSSLNISVFVCDYDHNASIEGLADTHYKVYKKFRDKSNNLPIILISRPDFDRDVPDSIVRRDIIYATFMNAIKMGDKNVYFIDGERLFKDKNRDSCTVDGCHPNDIGFLRMAEVIGNVVNKAMLVRSF